jgi:hypothetical protein
MKKTSINDDCYNFSFLFGIDDDNVVDADADSD